MDSCCLVTAIGSDGFRESHVSCLFSFSNIRDASRLQLLLKGVGVSHEQAPHKYYNMAHKIEAKDRRSGQKSGKQECLSNLELELALK